MNAAHNTTKGSGYIADPKWNGTMQRAIANILDNELIGHVTIASGSLDALVDKIVAKLPPPSTDKTFNTLVHVANDALMVHTLERPVPHTASPAWDRLEASLKDLAEASGMDGYHPESVNPPHSYPVSHETFALSEKVAFALAGNYKLSDADNLALGRLNE